MSCQVILIHLGSFYSSSVALGSLSPTFSHNLGLPQGETRETYMIKNVGYFSILFQKVKILLHIFCHLYQKMLIWPVSDKQLKIWKDWHQPHVFIFNRILQSLKHREPYCSYKNFSIVSNHAILPGQSPDRWPMIPVLPCPIKCCLN